jgi:hypothetical protein
LIAKKAGEDVADVAGSLEKLREATKGILSTDERSEDGKLQEILNNLLGSAQNITEARTKIEAWFNEGMERATGWYKRWVQCSLLIVALVVTVSFNVDSLKIMEELMNNSKLRAALVASAEQTVKTSPATGSTNILEIEKKIKELNLPIGWGKRVNVTSGQAIAVGAGWLYSPTNTAAAYPRSFLTSQEWKAPAPGTVGPPRLWHNSWEPLKKSWMGWLLTAGALSLGAPFWFDLMNKIINLRASGKKPEPPAPEPAKPQSTTTATT